jgi:L-asparagine transporter-like permease
VSVFIVYIACAIAAWRLRRLDVRTNGNPFVAPGGPLVPLLTCAAVGGMLAETATRREWGAVAVVLMIALAIYALRARRLFLALRRN